MSTFPDFSHTKDVVGYEGMYKVTRDGQVLSIRSDRMLKLSQERGGYISVELNAQGRSKRVKVHRLVAEAYLPNPENKPTVNHKNSVRDDNRLDNLEWATQSENVRHGFREGGRDTHGERHSHNKLTEEQVREILGMRGFQTQQRIADMFGVSRENISRIHRRLTWTHIQI